MDDESSNQRGRHHSACDLCAKVTGLSVAVEMAFAQVHPAQTPYRPYLPDLQHAAGKPQLKAPAAFFDGQCATALQFNRTFRVNPWSSSGFLKLPWACVPCLRPIEWRTPFGTDHAPPYQALFWGYQQTAMLLKITLRLNNSGIWPMHRASQPGSTQAYQARGVPDRTGWDGASTLSLACQRRRVSACRSLAALGGFQTQCG